MENANDHDSDDDDKIKRMSEIGGSFDKDKSPKEKQSEQKKRLNKDKSERMGKFEI